MIRQAFTLIEIIIATLIASIVAGLLFVTFSQINLTSHISERRMNFETKEAWFQYYLERDLAGACLVLQPEEEQKQAASEQQEKNKQPAKEDAEKKVPAKKAKKIEKVFVYTHEGPRFESLNFITNNALPKFWNAKDAKLTPLIARVNYRLQEEKGNKGSFQLVRQEGAELDPDKFNSASVRGYSLVTGIKDLTLKFTAKFIEETEEKKTEEKQPTKPAQQPQQQQPQAQKKEAKKIKVTFKDVDDWNSDAIEKNRQAAQKEKRKGAVQKLIPVYVEVSGSFWDDTKKKSTPFSFIVPIIAEAEFKKREKPAPPMQVPQQKPGQRPQIGPQQKDGTITEEELKKMVGTMFSHPATPKFNVTSKNNAMMNGYNRFPGMPS